MSWDIIVTEVVAHRAVCNCGFKWMVDVTPGRCDWMGTLTLDPDVAEREAAEHQRLHDEGWERYEEHIEVIVEKDRREQKVRKVVDLMAALEKSLVDAREMIEARERRS